MLLELSFVMISAKSLWPQAIVLEQYDFVLYGPLTNRIPCLQAGLFRGTFKILDWWNTAQIPRGAHFKRVNEETALKHNNRWIAQMTTKYYTRLMNIKPRETSWEIQIRLEQARPGLERQKRLFRGRQTVQRYQEELDTVKFLREERTITQQNAGSETISAQERSWMHLAS